MPATSARRAICPRCGGLLCLSDPDGTPACLICGHRDYGQVEHVEPTLDLPMGRPLHRAAPPAIGTATCGKCGRQQPLSEFRWRADKGRWSRICRECEREYRRLWVERHSPTRAVDDKKGPTGQKGGDNVYQRRESRHD